MNFPFDLSLQNLQILTYVFDWLYFTQCLTYYSSINHLVFCTVFDSISSNIDEILLINPSANVFVVGDFKVHHKDWLAYSGGTDIPGELCYNFFISNDLTQIVNFPSRIHDYDFPACCFGFIYFF